MLYQKIIENLVLPFGDLILKTKFIFLLHKWRGISKLSKTEIDNLADENLRKILIYSSEKVNYYKNLGIFSKINSHMNTSQILKLFPIITKKDIKNNINDFIVLPTDNLIKESSSGSSGIQGTVYMSKIEESNNRAIQIHWWEWAGYKLGMPIIQTGMTAKRGFTKTIKDKILKTEYVLAFQLDEKNIKEVLENQIKQPKKMLLGYASSLYLIAKFAKKNNYKIHFDSVVSWGDKMFDNYRKTIEETFNTKVFDTYACTEGFMIAAQCKSGNYHIMSPQVHLELLNDDNQEVEVGEIGNVVVSRLDNYSMPLIRYKLGDLAIKKSHSEICNCGMNYPLLGKIIGRDTDIVKTNSGKHLIVHFFTAIFEHYPDIKQFRVIQENLDCIIIEYIPELNFNATVLNKIETIIHDKLGEKLPINFVSVDNIPNTPSGKPQIIKSFLNDSK